MIKCGIFAKNVMEVFQYHPRSERETRTKDLLASQSDYSSAMLSVSCKRKEREELAYQLERQYGVPCTALMTSKTIVMKAPSSETPKIMQYVARANMRARVANRFVPKLPVPVKSAVKALSLDHVAMLNAYEAHKTTTGERSTVAIIDTGVDYTHPVLKNNFDREIGYDFVTNSEFPKDRHGHGTHVAGIVKAIAPGVRLKALRVLNDQGVGSEADVLLAYEWCYKRAIPILNCSLGASAASSEEREVVLAAQSQKCLIVAAAGNESDGEEAPDQEGYPAWFDGVQSIASIDRHRKHSSFSNMGKVEFSALGENIMSTLPNNEYGSMTGTSMACPCVAGAFALQHSAHQVDLEDRLKRASTECQTGFGRQYE